MILLFAFQFGSAYKMCTFLSPAIHCSPIIPLPPTSPKVDGHPQKCCFYPAPSDLELPSTRTLGYVAPSLLLFLFFDERLALAGLFVPISIFGPGGLLSGVQGSALSSSIGDSSSVGCIFKVGTSFSMALAWRARDVFGDVALLGCRHLG